MDFKESFKKLINRSPFSAIFFFELYEYFKNKWMILYTCLFFGLCVLIFQFDSSEPMHSSISLLNIVLLIVPLFSLFFGSISFLESMTFIEVLLVSNATRKDLFFGKYFGLGVGFSITLLVGLGLSFVISLSNTMGVTFYVMLIVLSILLNFIFLALSFLISTYFSKREVAFVILLLIWFYFYIIYDLLIISLGISLREYPLELPLFLMVLANPIDLIRIFLLLKLDYSDLFGVGAAMFKAYLGQFGGLGFTILLLLIWIFVPVVLGYRKFSKKDL